jgi:ABC-type transporter Mla maintaining outer membrane lipid asymmetry permease subunit MlaE
VTPPFEFRELARQLDEIGSKSFPLVALAGAAIGAILTGDGSEAGELASFLEHAQLLFGFHVFFQREHLPLCFWTGVTLLGVIGLLLLVMRHFRRRPRGTAAMASSPP